LPHSIHNKSYKTRLDPSPYGAEKKYNVKEILDGIKPEKERQKEVDQLLRDGKVVTNSNPETDREKETGKKRTWKIIRWTAAAIAAIIGVLAGLFALLDSDSFNEFIKNLFSK